MAKRRSVEERLKELDRKKTILEQKKAITDAKEKLRKLQGKK